MKTLLQINSVVNSGSTGRIAEEIGQTAIAAGWESYIAYGRNERPSSSKLIKIGNNNDIKLHGLKTRLFDRHGLGSRSATDEFIKQIEVIKPDIIHLHNLHGYYINIEVLFHYLKKVNVPVVWTFHDCWPITGHCSYFTFVGCEKWKTQCYECPQKTKYPASYFIDSSRKNYILKKELFTSLSNLTLVSVSQWLSGILNESFLQKYPIKVINNGINTEVFKPSSSNTFRVKYGFEDKFILLGVASIWDERKGLKDYIELSKLLGRDFQIVLVGLTKKQIEQLPDNILGIERTESVEMLAEIYSSANIVLNLSYEETFGLTTVEGFACGTPGIVYNATASPELIDVSTGIVVEQGNINKLTEAIYSIKKKGKEYYSEACVNRAHKLYKKEDRYKEYIQLYNELIS
ncbi:group 1 glycosyl transferase [Fermentimonas caenicola]|uniref:Group 1 glycosyl transferase n=1 Tax=Fermentimonas caenicola TaxID=1562970 RepID=A0A098BYM1_9BACT|nr:group 1 glycosyl transferase [Fermentimonas caenicola]